MQGIGPNCKQIGPILVVLSVQAIDRLIAPSTFSALTLDAKQSTQMQQILAPLAVFQGANYAMHILTIICKKYVFLPTTIHIFINLTYEYIPTNICIYLYTYIVHILFIMLPMNIMNLHY